MKEKPEYFLVKEEMDLELDKFGRFIYFILKKRDYNTFDALKKIAVSLNIPLKRFGYAGLKDKRAITEQFISVFGVKEDKLKSLNLKDIEIKIVGRGSKRIKLGGLTGNKFKVFIGKEKIKKFDFFANYFGEQRFSSNNVELGRKLVKKEKVEGDKFQLRMYLSAYQGYLFNEVLRSYLKNYDYSEREGYIFVNKKLENFKIPLLSFDSRFDKKIKAVFLEIIKKESIKLEDFIFRDKSFLVSDTVYRDAFARVRNLKYSKGWVEFSLDKGSYATVFVKKITNPE